MHIHICTWISPNKSRVNYTIKIQMCGSLFLSLTAFLNSDSLLPFSLSCHLLAYCTGTGIFSFLTVIMHCKKCDETKTTSLCREYVYTLFFVRKFTISAFYCVIYKLSVIFTIFKQKVGNCLNKYIFAVHSYFYFGNFSLALFTIELK